jgi:glycosyltransferase involved in cell wall biosynthesis
MMRQRLRLNGGTVRILVAHNRYQYSGGEDGVVRDEVALLERHGHAVRLIEQDNDAIRGLRGKITAAASVFYSSSSRARMKQAIDDFHPDLVHVHNWFPMLSPSVFMEASAAGVPTVQTLHNFRMLCANALLYRNGAVCTDCLGKSLPLDGVAHGCYRGSRTGSAVVTAAYGLHRFLNTWDCVDLFIAVSDFQRDILVRGGLPAEKIVVKPNFIGSDTLHADGNPEDFALFVGRLSPEKGIRTLLSGWNSGRIPLLLKIIGDGPMADEVRSSAGRNGIEYLGAQVPEAVYRQMAKARFLVFPSDCFETFGRTIIEAFSQGTPVLAANLGGVPELVQEGVTGYRFAAGNAEALVAGTERFPGGGDYQRMRQRCRDEFLGKFTAQINYNLLMEIYARAIAARRRRGKNR